MVGARFKRRLSIFSVGLLLLLLAPSLRADSEPENVRVPAELIWQLFRDESTESVGRHRPFDFEELTALLEEPRFRNAVSARELTRRYLNLTYPAGETAISSLVDASLPDEVLQQLFEAPEGSARFAFSGDLVADLTTLGGLPAKARQTLLGASANVVTTRLPEELDLASIVRLHQERFQKLVPYWGANIYVADSSQQRILTSSPTAEHLLAELLTEFRSREVRCALEAETCSLDSCATKTDGGGFATVKFLKNEGLLVAPGDQVLAGCRYESIYRQEFEDRVEVEVAFGACRLLAVNGRDIREEDSLLKDLVGIE